MKTSPYWTGFLAWSSEPGAMTARHSETCTGSITSPCSAWRDFTSGPCRGHSAEAFLRAGVALPRYRNTGAPFVAWLYGIARHVVADERAARHRIEPRAEPPDQSTNPGPDEQVGQDDRLRKSRKQVTRLGGRETLPKRSRHESFQEQAGPGPLAAQAASVASGDESVCLLAGAEGRLPCSK